MTDEILDVLDDDTPSQTDNGPRPEDGEQPTQEEIDTLLAFLLDEGEDDDDE